MKKLILIPILLFVLSACRKDHVQPAGEVLVIGHGGNGFQMFTNPYPSNTLTSIRRALEGVGADGVEVDVQLSRDHVPVLYHDNQLESQTSGFGCIPEKTWDELKTVKYRRDISNEIYTTETLIRLEDVLKLYQGYTPKPFLYLDVRLKNECGQDPDFEIYSGILREMINRHDASAWVVVESPSREFLEIFGSGDTDYQLALDCNNAGAEIAWLKQNRINTVVCAEKEVSHELAVHLEKEGIRTVLFNVKTQSSVKAALSKKPFAIQSDNLELTQEYLR